MQNILLQLSAHTQTLDVIVNQQVMQRYCVSTGKKGLGEQRNSEQTPRGLHQIKLKIGDGLPDNTVFVGRRPTGEIYTPALAAQYPGRDWILTRILWLSGLEPGKNRFGSVDTLRRFIYIHGTPDSTPLGQPGSHGCIRMHNQDLKDLFSIVEPGTKLLITV